MAKKQTRRSVSVSRDTYDRLKTHLAGGGVSMSSFTEAAIDEAIDNDKKLAAPMPARPDATAVPGNGKAAAQ